MNELIFSAEVKSIAAKKLASLDVGYTLTLYTDDAATLALGALDGDSRLKVKITVEE